MNDDLQRKTNLLIDLAAEKIDKSSPLPTQCKQKMWLAFAKLLEGKLNTDFSYHLSIVESAYGRNEGFEKLVILEKTLRHRSVEHANMGHKYSTAEFGDDLILTILVSDRVPVDIEQLSHTIWWLVNSGVCHTEIEAVLNRYIK